MSQENKNRKSKKIEPKNLLIIRTDRIGDVVLSLPLAEIVKKYFPECKITFLIKEYTKALVESHPFIDNYIILPESVAMRKEENKIPIKQNVDEIKKYKFDSSILVYPTFQTALISFFAGIKNRIGTGYRWYSFLFNYKIYVHRKYAEKHELEFNIGLLKAFGIEEKINFDNVHFNIKINEKSAEKVQNLLKINGINNDKPVIIIHPGSGGSAVDLPLPKFKALVKELSDKKKFQIIVTGSESEKKMCEELIVKEDIKNFAGLLNLSELIALINECHIFVSNSTGPIHIAAALGKYTIGFYPKILSTSAKRWGPYTNKRSVFTPETNCENCSREQCDNLDCMNSIKVTEVVAEVDRIYNLILHNGENN